MLPLVTTSISSQQSYFLIRRALLKTEFVFDETRYGQRALCLKPRKVIFAAGPLPQAPFLPRKVTLGLQPRFFVLKGLLRQIVPLIDISPRRFLSRLLFQPGVHFFPLRKTHSTRDLPPLRERTAQAQFPPRHRGS